MHVQLRLFSMHLELIAEKLSRRLPAAERSAGEVKRLLRAIDELPELASFFSSELRLVHRLLKRRVDHEDAARPGDERHLQQRLAGVRRELDELRTFCAFVGHPIPQRRGDDEQAVVADGALLARGAPAGLKQLAHLNCACVDGAVARTYAGVVLQHRMALHSLARAGLSPQMIREKVLQKACREISGSFERFKASDRRLQGLARVERREHTSKHTLY
jgi:hypothetical protein